MKNEIKDNLIDYFFAGKAGFSIVQDKTSKSNRKVVEYEINSNENRTVFFIYCKGKLSNKMSYQGYIVKRQGGCVIKPKKGFELDPDYNAEAIKGLNWVFNHAVAMPRFVHIVHNGKCARCGRKLTDIESIQAGLGPECRKKVLG